MDEQTEVSSAEADGIVSAPYDKRFRHLGFDAGVPVFEAQPQFSVADVRQSLFDSTYNNLITLQFDVPNGDASQWHVAMVVELVQLIFLPHAIGAGDKNVGCWPHPEYYVRGFTQMSGFDPSSTPIRMNAVLEIDGNTDGTIASAYVQAVRSPSSALDDVPFRWGRTGFGQD